MHSHPSSGTERPRRFAVFVAAALVSCSTETARTPRPPQPTLTSDTAASIDVGLGGGKKARIDVLSIGTVSVKRCHETLCQPETSTLLDRIGQILGADDFQPPLPILSYVVRHPEGTFVVDTGELRRFNDDPGYYACDPSNGQIDKNLLRVSIDRELGEQLTALGLTPKSLAGVVLTHLHADHTGGVPWVGSVPVYTSKTDFDLGPSGGATTCRSLSSANLSFVEGQLTSVDGDPVDQVFGRSIRLTNDGALRIVPTPGHTPGALSVLLRGESVDLLFIGDAAFDEAMIADDQLAGIDVDLAEAKGSYAKVRAWVAKEPTIVLPAHDLSAAGRLARGEVSRF